MGRGMDRSHLSSLSYTRAWLRLHLDIVIRMDSSRVYANFNENSKMWYKFGYAINSIKASGSRQLLPNVQSCQPRDFVS